MASSVIEGHSENRTASLKNVLDIHVYATQLTAGGSQRCYSHTGGRTADDVLVLKLA